MELGLKNFGDFFSKEDINKANKLLVRECDEVEKNQFVAYVDDQKNSYDIKLTFDKGGLIIDHTCDCGSTTDFCVHQLALLISLNKAEKKNLSIQKKKKKLPYEQVFENIQAEDLKNWLREQLSKNKDLAIRFTQHFTKNVEINKEEVIRLTEESFKTVVGRKRKIDVTLAKNLVDTWSELHKPVLSYIEEHISEDESVKITFFLLDECIKVDKCVTTTSVKISSYIENIYKQIKGFVLAIPEENQGTKWAYKYFVNAFMYNLPFISTPIEISSFYKARSLKNQQEFASLLMDHCFDKNEMNPKVGGKWNAYLLKMVIETQLFNMYGKYFKIESYNTEFNLLLIENYILIGEFEEAKIICLNVLENTSYIPDKLIYINKLCKIYELQKDWDAWIEIQKKHIFESLNYVDFQRILVLWDKSNQRDEWENSLLHKAKSQIEYSEKSRLFCMEYYLENKDYSGLVRCIKPGTPLYSIIENMDIILKAPLNLVLNTLLKNREFSPELWQISYDKGHYYERFRETIQAISEIHPLLEIKMEFNKLNKNRIYINNSFGHYIDVLRLNEEYG